MLMGSSSLPHVSSMSELGGPAYGLCSKKLYIYKRCLIERLSIASEKERQKLDIAMGGKPWITIQWPRALHAINSNNQNADDGAQQ